MKPTPSALSASSVASCASLRVSPSKVSNGACGSECGDSARAKLVDALGAGVDGLAAPSWAAASSAPRESALPVTHAAAAAPSEAEATGHERDDRQQRIPLINLAAEGRERRCDEGGQDAAAIEAFCETFGKGLLAEEALLEELQAETRLQFPRAGHMASGEGG